jgi:MFS family permease
MTIEGWLNAVSNVESRGRVFAAYTMINLTVVTAGMQLVHFGSPMSFELFSLVAVLYSLAAVPVALTRTAAPAAPRRARLRLVWLFGVSPAAMLGSLFAGLANAAFWALSPLYGKAVGLSDQGIALFMTIIVLSGAVSQWPIGLLSDRLGRRAVSALIAIIAAVAALALSAMTPATHVPFYVAAAVYGAGAFPAYALCVAHANDLVHRKRAVEVSSGLLMTFSIGAILGPLLASLLMAEAGNRALFIHAAIAQALLAFVVLVRITRRPRLPLRHKEGYVAIPRTSPAVFDLDPRAEREVEDERVPERVQ